MRRHHVSAATLTAMARGGGGPEAVATLLSARRSRHRVALRALLDRAADTGLPGVGAAYRTLVLVEATAPRAVAAVLDDPVVGAWLVRTVRALHAPGRAARPADLALVAVAAAIRGGVDVDVDLAEATQHGGLRLPTLGVLDSPGTTWGTTRLRTGSAGSVLSCGPRRALIPADVHRTAEGWRGNPLVAATADDLTWAVRLEGLDPGAGPRIPPDDLGDPGGAARWRTTLHGGWRVLGQRHRAAATEVAAALSVVAPLTELPEPLSITDDDAAGAVWMTRPPDAESVALTLAHEIQHFKLTGLAALVPLVAGETGRRWYAPWRDDPRPTAGLLQGAYAHLGVAGFWRTERAHRVGGLRAHVEFARWRRAAADTARLLSTCAELTDTGRGFAAGMLWTLDRWGTEPVPAAAATVAARLRRTHRLRWAAAHGALPDGS